jgi:teichuronic acid biosynthesis glycosyltransferase TuaG
MSLNLESRFQIIASESKNPLVSVIIPTYNSEKFIFRTLKSVADQSYPNLEIIVIDDCSSDGTTLVVEKFIQNDERFKIIKLVSNSGNPGATRNYALDHVHGDFIALLDHDDIWLKNKIKAQLSFLLTNDLDFVYSPMWQFKRFNPFFGILYIRPKVKSLITFEMLLCENLIQSSSVLVSAKALISTGKFDANDSYRGIDDYDMWLRMSLNYRIGQLNQIQGLYRVIDSAISQNQNMLSALHNMQERYPSLVIPRRETPLVKIFAKLRHYPRDLFELALATLVGRFKNDQQSLNI